MFPASILTFLEYFSTIVACEVNFSVVAQRRHTRYKFHKLVADEKILNEFSELSFILNNWNFIKISNKMFHL